MTADFTGRVALIAGGNRGFGRAIAEGFAAAGAAVVVTGRTKSQLDEVVASIGKAGGRALGLVCDVTSREDVERVQAETRARFGDASVLVHNAGVPWPFGPVWHVDPDEWWAAQAVHVRGAMLHIHAFVPAMVERGGGHVILVSSNAGTAVRPNLSGYAVAKATQIRLAGHLGAEGKAHGVFAFAIQPGNVLTELSELTVSNPDAQKYIPDFVGSLSRRKAAGEDGTAGLQRCAEMCLELASGRCDLLSGSFIRPEDDLAARAREASAQRT